METCENLFIVMLPQQTFHCGTLCRHAGHQRVYAIGNTVYSCTTQGLFRGDHYPLRHRFINPRLCKQYNMIPGEDVYLRVHGSGQEIPIRLERSLVNIEETYVGLANLRQITLHNRSDIMVHFYWSNFSSQIAEDLDRETYLKILQLDEDEEQQRFQNEESLGLLSSDKLSIVSRNYINKKKVDSCGLSLNI